MAQPNRTTRARRVRDEVLPLIRALGRLERIRGRVTVTVLAWRPTGWSFMLRTPFGGWSTALPTARTYLEPLLRSRQPMLPYGLDAWRRTKVMSVEWGDDEVRLVSFAAGSWDRDLLDFIQNVRAGH